MKRRMTSYHWLVAAVALGLVGHGVAQNFSDPAAGELETDATDPLPVAGNGVNDTSPSNPIGANDTSPSTPSSGSDIVPAPAPAPTAPTIPPTNSQGCYDNLSDVYNTIANNDFLFQMKTFILCPGSVFDLGFLIPGSGIEKGEIPLIPRSNTEYLCGEDGALENNCVMRGGDFGVIAVPVFFREDPVVNNVRFKGLTFESQAQYAGFMATQGQFEFVDCIFVDMTNFGPFLLAYEPINWDGRDLALDAVDPTEENPWIRTHQYIQAKKEIHERRRLGELEDPKKRSAQQRQPSFDEDSVMEVSYTNCKFERNSQIARKLGVEFGVVTIKAASHTISFDNCIFRDNNYGDDSLAPIGYAILNQGAPITITNSCFINNDFRGAGAVVLEQTPGADEFDFSSTNYVTSDDDLGCPFIAYFATAEDRENLNFQCIAAVANDCKGEVFGPKATEAPAPGTGSTVEVASSAPGTESASSAWQVSPLLVTAIIIGVSSCLMLLR